jgi:HSP20 family protein
MFPISLINAISDNNFFPQAHLELSYRDDVQFVEEKDKYIFTMELPGFKKENIQLDIKDNTISVEAERKAEYSEDAKLYRRESSSSKKTASYHLPNDALTDKANAKLEDGLLKVEFAKKEEAKPKQITIN